MIVDHIDALTKYAQLIPKIHSVLEFMKTHNLIDLNLGKHEILNSDVFVIRETYISKSAPECYFEGHLKYLDIQLVLKGCEKIGYHPKSHSIYEVKQPYQEVKDVETYDIKDYTEIMLSEGMFAIMFPEDLHMPKLMHHTKQTIEKVVFKIKL